MTLNFYNQRARQYFFQTINAKMTEQYERFLPLIPKEGCILDLGCGSGRDSYYFKQKGYKIVAVDGSKELAKHASDLLGQPVLNQMFHEINFNNQFDGIWACASLLHVCQSQMFDILTKMKRSLKPGGNSSIFLLKRETVANLKKDVYFNIIRQSNYVKLSLSVKD